MTEQEKTALTDEILTLQKEINEFGRKSVPLVIQCGKRLTEIQKALPHGRWMDWQVQYSDVLSKSTINRYKRVYDLSLVTSLEGKTLTEVYGVMKKPRKNSHQTTTDPTKTEQSKHQTEDLTPLEVIDELVTEIIDTINGIEESESAVALGKLKALVEFYNDRMELKVAA